MAKKVQKEAKLRQVSFETTTVAPLSMGVNASFAALQDINSMEQVHSTIQSPVMKSLGVSVYSQAPVAQVNLGEAESAYTEVGIECSTNSRKCKKRQEEAQVRRDQQKDLFGFHQEFESEQSETRKQEMQADKGAAVAAVAEEQQKQVPLSVAKKNKIADAAEKKNREERDKQKRLDAYAFFEKQDRELKHIIPENMDSLYSMLLDKDKYSTIKMVISTIPYYEAEIQRLFSEAQAKKSSAMEKRLRASQARLMVMKEFAAHVSVVESLMMNEYYSYIPLDKMKALSYDELKKRLDAEYARPANARNEKLIDYYQNLIRLKMLGFEDGATVESKTEAYEIALEKQAEKQAAANPQQVNPAPVLSEQEKKEMISEAKRIMEDFKALKKFTEGGDSLQDKDTFLAQFQELYGGKIAAYEKNVQVKWPKEVQTFFYEFLQLPKQKNDPIRDKIRTGLPESLEEKADSLKGVNLTDEQKKGIEDLDQFIMHKSLSEKQRRIFTSNFLKVSPEQRLIAYYLIENDKLESASSLNFYSALYNYVPDAEKFKSQVKSKASWDKISLALRASMGINQDVKAFSTLSQKIETSEGEVAKDRKPGSNSQPQQKIAHLLDTISARGNMLRVLYKSAGLHPDMPPDMAEDPVVRQRLVDEYKKVYALVDELNKIPAPNGAPPIAQPNYNGVQSGKKKEEIEDGESPDKAEDYIEAQELTQEFGEVGIEGLAMGGGANVIAGSVAYLGPAAAGLGIFTLTALAGTIASCVELHKAWGGMTEADKAEKVIGVIQELGSEASLAAETAASISSIVEQAEHAVSNAPVVEVAHTTVETVAGSLAVAAGAVKMTTAVVGLVREGTSKYEVAQAKKKLPDKAAQTPDEQIVARFLDHEDKEVARRASSAAVELGIGGALTLAGGLALTGVFAPVGAVIGVGAGLAELILKGVDTFGAKPAFRKEAVDEYLGLDTRVETLMKDPAFQSEHPEMDKKDVKKKLRDEVLGAMGFSSVNDCYRHICFQFAQTLVRKVFYDQKDAQYEMYVLALKSLGLKVSDRDKLKAGEEPKPSIQAIVTRMMS